MSDPKVTRPERDCDAMDGRYYAASRGRVYKAPVATKTETGQSISVGFPVCTMTEYVGEEAAQTIATMLNLAEIASAFDLGGRVQVVKRSGSTWAIWNGASCLNRDLEWEWEPQPSSREDDYITRTRWPTAQEAISFARANPEAIARG